MPGGTARKPACFGGIEAGGTKIRCVVAAPGTQGNRWQIMRQATIPTTSPGPTLEQVRTFFGSAQPIVALGVASFGPLGVDDRTGDYGEILDSPKLKWQGVNWLNELKELAGAIAVHTDVVGAAVGEFAASTGSKPEIFSYVTVGTGIGAGTLVRGQPLPGAQHAEFGHQFVRRHSQDTFAGSCPFHGDCLEGLASAVAIRQRWAQAPENLQQPLAWEIQAHYLAQGCVNLLRLTHPQRIVLGGGVMQRQGLLNGVHQACEELLGGYYLPGGQSPDQLIVPPQLGADSGLIGAVELAWNST